MEKRKAFDLLDCVIAATAYETQYRGIKGMYEGEGKTHLQP